MAGGNQIQRGGFPTTHWSLVARAGGDQAEARREALDQLLRCYLPALKAHLVYSRRMSPDDADDLLQDFVAGRLIEKGLLGQADSDLGKFRTYLLTVVDRFMIDQKRRRGAKKRSPGDAVGGERAVAVEWLADQTSADIFDVAWAREVIADTLRRMQAECEAAGRDDIWRVFERRLLDPLLKGAAPVDYEQLVEQFKLDSVAQASNILITAKRTFTRLLRMVVGRYALGQEAIESEIRDLHTILAQNRMSV
jgi:DNA-directed RNA polymerase specialized sigma24 family protein